MNLINKDALLQTLDWNGIIAYQPIEAERAARDMIESMPIIEAAPVVHAKWIQLPHKNDRVCSRCEHNEPYKCAETDAEIFSFCPFCGALMDGRTKNE